MESEKLLTSDEVAALLRVPVRYVHLLVRRGELRGMKVGRLYRFRREDVDRYLESAEVEPQKADVYAFGRRT